jgi:hypothetical protein
MRMQTWQRGAVLCVLACGLFFVRGPASPGPTVAAQTVQPSTVFVPRFEALAETKLLMNGLTYANYRGLQRLLRDKPADVETWKFARGQALFIGESGNLLLLRPPRNEGRNRWMQLAMEMRDAAKDLAHRVGREDYEGSKRAMVALANSCNHCHQSFRVATRIRADAERTEPGEE